MIRVGVVIQALRELAICRDVIAIVYPVHPKPNLSGRERILGRVPRIRLLEPQEYLPFVWPMNRAYRAAYRRPSREIALEAIG